MPNLATILKTAETMTEAELKEHIRQIREKRKIKTKVKKDHTPKGKKQTRVNIVKKFAKMSDDEREALIKMLKG